jgi:hypothetical protein
MENIKDLVKIYEHVPRKLCILLAASINSCSYVTWLAKYLTEVT